MLNVAVVVRPVPEKTYFLTYALNESPNQPALLHNLISLHCPPHKETLHPWLSKMSSVKILIRLLESDLHLCWAHVHKVTFYDIEVIGMRNCIS